MSADLNIHDLYKSTDLRRENKKKTFESVLCRIHCKIKQAAEHDHLACFYTVPEVIVGIPLYNITECIEYAISALKNNGFLIRFVYPNNIYINWDPKELNRDGLRVEYKPKREDTIDRFLLEHKSPHKNGKFSLNLDDV